MQQRLESYIEKLQKRKEDSEKKLNPPLKKNPRPAFFPQETKVTPPLKKLIVMESFLEHLKKYKATTLNAIKNNPENAAFYNAHLESVTNLLEDIEKKYPYTDELTAKDFELTVPTELEYKKTFCDSLNNIALFARIGGTITGTIGGLIAAIAAAYYVLPVVFSLLGSAITPGTVISPEVFTVFLLIITVPVLAIILTGFLVGFIVGAIPGALIGSVIGAFANLCIAKPLRGNPYLEGTAFDCELLKKAYVEMVTVAERNEVSANDGMMEENHPQII